MCINVTHPLIKTGLLCWCNLKHVYESCACLSLVKVVGLIMCFFFYYLSPLKVTRIIPHALFGFVCSVLIQANISNTTLIHYHNIICLNSYLYNIIKYYAPNKLFIPSKVDRWYKRQNLATKRSWYMVQKTLLQLNFFSSPRSCNSSLHIAS
jgi:hypothetical protein